MQKVTSKMRPPYSQIATIDKYTYSQIAIEALEDYILKKNEKKARVE